MKLLVLAFSARRNPDDGRTWTGITYRFGPPPDGLPGDPFVVHFKNGRRS